MPKKKVAIAISDWLLDELDDAAERSRLSRSAVVEEAVTDYVVRKKAHASEQTFRREATLALEDMQRFADEYDADPGTALEPSAIEKLRALRADGRGVPE